MDRIRIKKIYKEGGLYDEKGMLKVSVPGSKSITNRALLIATLASGKSVLNGVLFSDDSRHFIDCVQKLGFKTTVDEGKCVVTIEGLGGRIPFKEASINVGSAGTAARFLAAVLGVSNGTYHMDASEQMRKRPMAPLLNSLKELGCKIVYPDGSEEGHFPFTLISNGFRKNEISINIDSSSQFLSALLIASVLCKDEFCIDVVGSHGMAYIEMTTRMMEQWGYEAEKRNADEKCDAKEVVASYYTKPGAYTSMNYDIEPDASGAAYFYAMCPLLGIQVCVPGIHFDSLQGDVAFLRVLEKMGCKATDTTEGIVLNPPTNKKGNFVADYHGIDVDMSAFSDQAITLAALAPFADSPTTITGIGHIRLQESDRLSAMATELTKMGIKVEEGKDFIKIYPGIPKPSVVETYEDHRMAMGFSLIGLRVEGIEIDNPMCCKKTFENYFDILDSIF